MSLSPCLWQFPRLSSLSLIEESLGSLTLNPRELFGFLGSDPWAKEAFQAPKVVEGDLNAAASTDTSFQRQTLGNKLVQAGVLSSSSG